MESEILERWSDPKKRDDLVYFIGRWLSKTGDLSQYRDELSVLGRSLDPEEVCALYTRLTAERLEFEWREEFVSYFPGSESYLPEPEVSESEFDALLAGGKLNTTSALEVQDAIKEQRDAATKRWWHFWKVRESE